MIWKWYDDMIMMKHHVLFSCFPYLYFSHRHNNVRVLYRSLLGCGYDTINHHVTANLCFNFKLRLNLFFFLPGISTKFAGSSCNDLVCVGGASCFISGHFDKKARFWDMRSDSPTQEVSLPGKITSLDISRDHYLLASVRDDSIEVLDLRMNSVIGEYR